MLGEHPRTGLEDSDRVGVLHGITRRCRPRRSDGVPGMELVDGDVGQLGLGCLHRQRVLLVALREDL